MKNLIVVALVIGLFSCKTKFEDPQSDISDQDLRIYKEAVSVPFPDYRTHFRSLDASEKSSVWKVKTELLISRGDWSQGQLVFINKIKSLITEDFFAKVLSHDEEKVIMDEAIEVFNEEELYLAFFIPHNFKSMNEVKEFTTTSLKQGGRLEEGDGECECYYSISCGLQVDCVEEGCEDSAGGCGIVGSTNCDGRCDV